MQEHSKETSRSKVKNKRKTNYIYLYIIYVYKVVWYTTIMVKKKKKNQKSYKKARNVFIFRFLCTVSKKRTALWMMRLRLVGLPILRDLRHAMQQRSTRTRCGGQQMEWSCMGSPGPPRDRGCWRSLCVRLEEEEEGRSLELHSEERCGIKYAEHLRASCYSSPLLERSVWNVLVAWPLCSALGRGEHQGAPGSVTALLLGNAHHGAQPGITLFPPKHRLLISHPGTATNTADTSGRSGEATCSSNPHHFWKRRAVVGDNRTHLVTGQTSALPGPISQGVRTTIKICQRAFPLPAQDVQWVTLTGTGEKTLASPCPLCRKCCKDPYSLKEKPT